MNVAIIGTGAYGMALASVFYNNKCNVKMWTNSEEEKNMLLKVIKLILLYLKILLLVLI